MPRALLRTLVVGLVAGAFLLSGLLAPGFSRADESEGAEDLLGGFEEEDDLLSGFEEEDEPGSRQELGAEDVPEAPRWWDLSGDIGLGASYNYLPHWSGSDDFDLSALGLESARTYWGNLSRLRLDLYLQLDLDLPAAWRARVSGWGFYDFAYLIHRDRDFTQEVLDLYEWEVDFREVWIQGSLLDNLDLKLGRQIVNWGRSDTVRVLDIVNPLDNREPGLVDIEDLKRPVTMLRLDYYLRGRLKSWNLQALVIPEIRYNQDPPYGHDFNPLPFPTQEDRPRHWGEIPEFGLAINGIFSGWDISFYGAYYFDDRPWNTFDMEVSLGPGLPPAVVGVSLEAVERQARVVMAGAGANYTVGSWLFKGELAFLDGLEFPRHELVLPPAGLGVRWDGMFDDKSRWDAMLGVEYYGFTNTQIAVEVVYRHLNDFEEGQGDMPFMPAPAGSPFPIALDPDYVAGMDNFPNYAREHEMTTAIRITQDLLNERLQLTALGIVFSNDSFGGSIIRLSADYDILDALILSGGIVLYFEGDFIEFQKVGDNDRLFLGIEYSF